MRIAKRRIDKTSARQSGNCGWEMGVETNTTGELMEMYGKFQIDEATARKFNVKRAERWFMRRHVGPHGYDIAGQGRPVA